MTALLYISYSSGLNEEDKLIINKSVFENREAVCIVIRDIRCNVKDKTKKLTIVISLTSVIWFSSLESAEGVGLNIPPIPIVRVQPSYQHSYELKIMKVIPRKTDRISYKSPKEILFLMYLTDPRLSSNQQVLGLVEDLRGGSLGLIGTVAYLVVIILIFSMSENFVPHPVDPG